MEDFKRNLWDYVKFYAPAFKMSLKLPRKNITGAGIGIAPPHSGNTAKPANGAAASLVQGRLRRYSDRMIASCKDLAAECAVSILLQCLFVLKILAFSRRRDNESAKSI